MQTVESIITSVYGRTTDAAAKLGVLPSAVSNWKSSGRFPSWAVVPVYEDARAKGVEIAVEDIPRAPIPQERV